MRGTTMSRRRTLTDAVVLDALRRIGEGTSYDVSEAVAAGPGWVYDHPDPSNVNRVLKRLNIEGYAIYVEIPYEGECGRYKRVWRPA